MTQRQKSDSWKAQKLQCKKHTQKRRRGFAPNCLVLPQMCDMNWAFEHVTKCNYCTHWSLLQHTHATIEWSFINCKCFQWQSVYSADRSTNGEVQRFEHHLSIRSNKKSRSIRFGLHFVLFCVSVLCGQPENLLKLPQTKRKPEYHRPNEDNNKKH